MEQSSQSLFSAQWAVQDLSQAERSVVLASDVPSLCFLFQTSGSMPAQLVTQSGENYVVHGTVDGAGQIAHTIRASPATVSNC